MAHVGWSSQLVDEALRASEKASSLEALKVSAASLGDKERLEESLTSLWHQVNSVKVRHTAHLHRGKMKEYCAAWREGESLVQISRRVDFPPSLLARLVIEEFVGVQKKQVGDLVRHPEKVSDDRLRRELEECLRVDEHYSPTHDAARHDVGIEYELLLRGELERRKLPFQHEDDLRDRGFAKTPDVLLTLPLGYLVSDRQEVSVINWIDSKAMFGAPAVYDADHRRQLLAYVNRLGAGAVIYWFGFAGQLQDVDHDILLLSRWPDPGTLFWPDGSPVVEEGTSPLGKNRETLASAAAVWRD